MTSVQSHYPPRLSAIKPPVVELETTHPQRFLLSLVSLNHGLVDLSSKLALLGVCSIRSTSSSLAEHVLAITNMETLRTLTAFARSSAALALNSLSCSLFEGLCCDGLVRGC